MNKDEMKMIDEMASIICKETSNKGLCEKCDFKKHEQFGYTYQCRKFDDATALYNEGCRLIADDEIVIKKSELARLKNLEINYEHAKQETAREILQIIKDEYEYIGNLERIICKKYGVELED